MTYDNGPRKLLDGLYVIEPTEADGYKQGVQDAQGNVVIPKEYFMIHADGEYIICKNDSGLDLYDKTGKEIYKNFAENYLMFMLP